MVSRVLVPMDDSEMADAALEFALSAFPSAAVTALHVAGGPTSYMGEAMSLAVADDVDAAAADRAEPVFERARAIAADAERAITTEVDLGSPAKTIIEHAEGFDLVVIGSHSSNIASRLLLGNVAETVARDAPVPVTIVR
ncbi:universal stress protein [Halonotius pteroides]|jgi:nucleotide-binding universal stress UspA family protein|uniref:Universal stress protein n=1 Tax=Halonotius pteroides TaxID=268735 RepID=A0A3A6QEB0_9EURY|nr:universal stress protein [Halonotius pteroides]RJX51513.1 universal stress protein [Halonotius pteroides]